MDDAMNPTAPDNLEKPTPPVHISYGAEIVTLAGVVVDRGDKKATPVGTVLVILADEADKVWASRTVVVGSNGRFVAELEVTALPASSTPYTVLVEYSGDPHFVPCTRMGRLQVDKAEQEIAFHESAPPSDATYGEGPFPLRATASSDPTGKAVRFQVVRGPAVLGPDGDQLTLTGAGEVVIEALADGDTNHHPASVRKVLVVQEARLVVAAESDVKTPDDAEQTIAPAPSIPTTGEPERTEPDEAPAPPEMCDTTTVISTSADESIFGDEVIFTAAAEPVRRWRGRPKGKACFYYAATDAGTGERTLLGTVRLMNGRAVLRTSGLAAGSYEVIAVYQGEGDFAGGTSLPLRHTVHPAAAVVTLKSSCNPSVFSQPVTFTAAVQADGAPAGAIDFYDGPELLATVPVKNGRAVLPSLTSLSAAVHRITAIHHGDDNYVSCTSDVLEQKVRRRVGEAPPSTRRERRQEVGRKQDCVPGVTV